MENKKLLRPDGSDSDEVKEFELPPARSRRPKVRRALAEAKASGGSGSCSLRCFSVFIVVAALTASVLLLGWLVMNMQRDINTLHAQLQKLESTDHSNLKESSRLQLSVKEQLKKMKKDEKNLAEVNKKIEVLNEKVKKINITVVSLVKSMQRKKSFNSIVKDVDQLQKGMADTFNNIKRLEDESVKMENNVGVFSKAIKEVKVEVSNITREMLLLKVDSHSPRKSATMGKGQTRKISAILEKILDGYESRMTNKTRTIAKVLRNHELKLEDLDGRMQHAENKTNTHHRQLALLKKISVLLTAEVRAYKNASDEKLNKILKLILNDLSKRDGNLTADLLSVRHTLPKGVQTLITRYVELSKARAAVAQPSTVAILKTTPSTKKMTGTVASISQMPPVNASIPHGPITANQTSAKAKVDASLSNQGKLNETTRPFSSDSISSKVATTATTSAHSTPLSSVNSTGKPEVNPTDLTASAPVTRNDTTANVEDLDAQASDQGVEKREDLSVPPQDFSPKSSARSSGKHKRQDSFLAATNERRKRLSAIKRLQELVHQKRDSDARLRSRKRETEGLGSRRSGRMKVSFGEDDGDAEENYDRRKKFEREFPARDRRRDSARIGSSEPSEDKDLYDFPRKSKKVPSLPEPDEDEEYNMEGGSDLGDTQSLEALDIAESGTLGKKWRGGMP